MRSPGEPTVRGRLPVVLFDGDCAFCTSSAERLARAFPGSLQLEPYQLADLTTLGLTEEECAAAVQWVGRDGRSAHGAGAVAAALRAGGADRRGPAGWMARGAGVVLAVPPASWVAAWTYRWVAANRYRLPGGTPACRR